MFKARLKNLSIILITIILTLGFSVSLQSLLAAWSNPTAIAPNNNTTKPLNVGNIGQSKNSGLILNAGAINDNGLIVQSGKVGIGTTNPNESLTVNGALSLVESTTTPAATAGYGKIYLKGVSSYAAEDAATKLLISADTDIKDSSLNKKTISNIGGVAVSSISRFGSGSMYFNGTSHLQITPSNDFNFGTSDFTVDFWAKDLSVNHSVVVQLSTGPHDSLIGYPYNGQLLLYLSSPNGQEDIAQLVSMGTVPGSSWTHYAVVRNGNNFYTFRNGVQISTFSSSLAVHTSSDYIDIGSYGNIHNLIGYVDELHIVKGVARWTSNFTPPSQPYPMTLSGNSFSPYFKDSAGNETALAGVGNSVSPLAIEYKTCSGGPTLNKASCIATCSSGYQVVGGGCEVVGGLAWNQIYVSKPTADNAGWDCRVSIDWEHADNMSAAGYAICVRQ